MTAHPIVPISVSGDFGRTVWKCDVCRRRIERVLRPGVYDRRLHSMGRYGGVPASKPEDYYWRHRPAWRTRALGEPLEVRSR